MTGFHGINDGQLSSELSYSTETRGKNTTTTQVTEV